MTEKILKLTLENKSSQHMYQIKYRNIKNEVIIHQTVSLFHNSSTTEMKNIEMWKNSELLSSKE